MRPVSRSHLFTDGAYVREVLGIRLPLNESYPYNHKLQSRIIHEQMILEGFWDDAKEMAGTSANVMKAFKKVSTTPETLKSLKLYFYKSVRHAKNQIYTLLNNIIEKLDKYNMPTFKKWAENTKGMLDKIFDYPNKLDGWKGGVASAGLGLAVKYVWDQIGEVVEVVNSGLKEFIKLVAGNLAGDALEEAKEKLTDFLKEKISEKINPVIKEKLQKVAGKLMAQFSGVGAWLDAAKTAFDSSKFVLDFLKVPVSRLLTTLKAESLVRQYVNGILLEANYGSTKDDSRIIQVKDMRIRVDIDDVVHRATKHSKERQSRHRTSTGGGYGISSKSINQAINAAIGDIINDYANGELRNGERFLIVAKTGKGIPLNIVGALNMRKGPDDFGVITVMRKHNFMSELPTYEVKV